MVLFKYLKTPSKKLISRNSEIEILLRSITKNELEVLNFAYAKALEIESRRLKAKVSSFWAFGRTGRGRRIVLDMSHLASGPPSERLECILNLIWHPDKVEERVGDLENQYNIIVVKHGFRYARGWFVWWGFWIFAAGLAAKLPGKLLLDALRSRIAGKG